MILKALENSWRENLDHWRGNGKTAPVDFPDERPVHSTPLCRVIRSIKKEESLLSQILISEAIMSTGGKRGRKKRGRDKEGA
jgi:hypothetical protein